MKSGWSTADVLDELGECASVCDLPLRHYGGRTAFAGPLATVRCWEDNVLVAEVLSTVGAGRVLVVDGGGSGRTALMGDRLAYSAHEAGWAGVLIHGAVRDVADLRGIDIGICALSATPRRSAKGGFGETDITVEFGGALFVPGRHLWCDEDGVVVADDRPNDVAS